MRDPRYQHQPWWIKAYRQVRYRPLGWLRIAWEALSWMTGNMRHPPPCRTYLEGIRMIRCVESTQTEIDMDHWYTQEEMKAMFNED